MRILPVTFARQYASQFCLVVERIVVLPAGDVKKSRQQEASATITFNTSVNASFTVSTCVVNLAESVIAMLVELRNALIYADKTAITTSVG
ncbi:hypothetical protein FRC18_001013 [Serendipita sp. 400]|nr:hypothetical protein FRC18_001013 [Serendipita sp. 400]